MGKIRWTEKASSHLRAIHDYISRDSPTYATRFITTLINRIGKSFKLTTYSQRVKALGIIFVDYANPDLSEWMASPKVRAIATFFRAWIIVASNFKGGFNHFLCSAQLENIVE